jgi:hypothetical protein
LKDDPATPTQTGPAGLRPSEDERKPTTVVDGYKALTPPVRGRAAVLASHRRFLVDMHVPDWDGDFMACMDPEQLASRVAAAQATVVTLPANNHAGLNFWPSSVGASHRGNGCSRLLPRALEAARLHGLATVVYYCVAYVEWYWEHFPDARVIDAAGRPRRLRVPSTGRAERFGVVCINSPSYRDFVVTQVSELVSQFDPDGFNLDMTSLPGVCFCRACRARVALELGGPVPTVVDWGSQYWWDFLAARRRWLAEFVEEISRPIREADPERALTHQSGGYVNNWASAASDRQAASADWLSADLYQDRATLSVSLKLFSSLSRHHPVELIHSWSAPTIFEHTATKTGPEILSVAASAVSNGAALSIIEAVNPDGSTELYRYRRARPAFALIQELEGVLEGRPVADVALYRSFEANVDLSEWGLPLAEVPFAVEPKGPPGSPPSHWRCLVAAGESLLERHLLFNVVTAANLGQLSQYQAVLISNVVALTSEEREAIDRYVKNGGCIYVSLSGASYGVTTVSASLPFWCEMLGMEPVGRSLGGISYMVATAAGQSLMFDQGEERPYTVHDDQLLLEITGEPSKVLAHVGLPYADPRGSVYASVLTDPLGRVTGYPALMERHVGAGRVIFAAAPMEIEKPTEQKDAFVRLVGALVSTPTLTVKAPPCVEVTMFYSSAQNAFLVCFNNTQATAPPVPIHDIRVKLRLKQPVSVVEDLPSGRMLDWADEGDAISFVLQTCETVAVVRVRVLPERGLGTSDR